MTSFGFSVGDIIAAGKLAKDIYENCFTREQAAGESPIRCQSIQGCLGCAFLEATLLCSEIFHSEDGLALDIT